MIANVVGWVFGLSGALLLLLSILLPVTEDKAGEVAMTFLAGLAMVSMVVSAICWVVFV